MTKSYRSLQKSYKPFSRFVIRTPALSLNRLLDHFSNCGNSEMIEVTELNDTAFISEAIFLASNDLYNAIGAERADKQTKSNVSESIALLKYYIRMTSRTTPFGLFSGCSIGEIEMGNSSVLLKEKDYYKAHSRLDSEYLDNIVNTLFDDSQVMSSVCFHINNTLYKLGDTYRFIEYGVINGFRTYRLASFEATEVLDMIVAKSKKSFQLQDIRKQITEYGTDEQIGLFIDQLVSSQFILPALEPGVTGPEVLQNLLDQTEILADSNHRDIHLFLKNISNRLGEINELGPGNSLDSYLALKAHMDSEVPNPAKSTFQVDLFPQVSNCKISRSFASELLEAASVLLKCGSTLETDIMKKFRDEFYTRYEEEEIPLLEALDPDIGLSFLNQFSDSNEGQLIKGMDYAMHSVSQHVSLNAFDRLILTKFNLWKANHTSEIEIYESDLANIPANNSKLPPVFHILFDVFKCGADTHLSHLQIVGSHSGASYLGRFCHGNDQMYSLASEITAKEASLSQDYLIADVVHLPQPRLGNIIHRPILSEYEIPIIAESVLDPDHVIPLADIMISVKGGRHIVLRSKKLDKKIRPVLTNAQNFGRTGIGIYRFLCMLQIAENGDGHTFSWNSYFQKELFLPRVRYKNTIFSLARWLLTYSEIQQFYEKVSVKDMAGILNMFKARSIPRYVWVVKGDNKLLLDLHNEWALKILYAEVKKSQVIVLNEYLYDADTALVKDKNGNFFSNEILMYFYESNN